MLRTYQFRRFVNFSTALLVSLATGLPATTQAQTPSTKLTIARRVTFEPRRDQPPPKTSIGAGRRDDGKCPQDRKPGNQASATNTLDQMLTPLVASPPNSVSLTTAERPTFLVYVPRTSAKALEFTLESSTGKGIYQTQVNLTQTPGVVAISMSKGPALVAGQDYRWIVAVMCESGDPKDAFSGGVVRRVQPDAALSSQITKANALDRVALYARNGIWYEAAATLADLRRVKPNDADVKTAWESLLKSAGLDAIAAAPLTQ